MQVHHGDNLVITDQTLMQIPALISNKTYITACFHPVYHQQKFKNFQFYSSSAFFVCLEQASKSNCLLSAESSGWLEPAPSETGITSQRKTSEAAGLQTWKIHLQKNVRCITEMIKDCWLVEDAHLIVRPGSWSRSTWKKFAVLSTRLPSQSEAQD